MIFLQIFKVLVVEVVVVSALLLQVLLFLLLLVAQLLEILQLQLHFFPLSLTMEELKIPFNFNNFNNKEESTLQIIHELVVVSNRIITIIILTTFNQLLQLQLQMELVGFFLNLLQLVELNWLTNTKRTSMLRLLISPVVLLQQKQLLIEPPLKQKRAQQDSLIRCKSTNTKWKSSS
jgi:hypothetical protein